MSSEAISSLSMHLAAAMALLVLASSSCSTAASLSNDEAAALLRWKASLENQSQSLLPSWDVGSNQSYCNWAGIACDNTSSIAHIVLNSVGLTGTLLSFSFSSFPHLVRFELYNNSFYGSIPAQIGNLSRLYYIDFSSNHFIGKVPSELGSLRNLQCLYLYDNKLSGTIPQELGMSTLVWDLQLSGNNLTGPIPTSIWNLTNLVRLVLQNNSLSGSIPTSIGNLTNLTNLYLFSNQLSGPIPQELGLLGSLKQLRLQLNNLVGSIPHSLGNLNSLTELVLFNNKLSGPIPSELANLTHLQAFLVNNNKLTGRLPQNLCLDGSLTSLGASNNNLTGNIPKSLRNCNSLFRVRLENNQLEGNLQEEFGVLPSLDYMDLSYNRFGGKLSVKWGQSRNLTKLVISNNQLTGNIPPVLAAATKLRFLDLSSNHLVGEIPKNLRELGFLFHLNLRNNKLSGNIPAEILGIGLRTLDLAANNLTGSIPREIANCENLQNLNLGENRLAGGIPFEIEKLHFLQTLDLGHNNLMGEIPSQLGRMPRLEKLNLSHNMLSGSIPSSFGDQPTSLTSIDISYNNLKGPLPNTKAFEDVPYEAYRGNNGLCGNQKRLIPCSSPKVRTKTKLVLLVVVPLVGTLFLSLVVVGIFQFLSKRVVLKAENEIQVVQNENLFEIWSYDGKIVYQNIIEATEDFNEKYCIGGGGYGTVYKAEFSSGLVVAVKKAHPSQDGNLVDLKSFRSEISALTKARHRNIIKLYGFCSDSRRSFLVYEFLEEGSLKNKLRNKEETLRFDWHKRMNCIKGVASGLCYMHHECLCSVIHRDISSKNILFDSECVAHISDFGTARLLNLHSNWTSFAGTFGYAAPELAYTMEVNAKLDIYSFGILTLEVLMGKHPYDLISSLPSLCSSSFSSLSSTFYGILLKDVLDNRLPPPEDQMVEEIVITTKLALACINTNPRLRPSMKQVSVELSKLRPFSKSSFDTITLGQLLDINCI